MLVSSMLFHVRDCVKTFKIIFSQVNSVIQAYQCMVGLFPNHVKKEEYRILGYICKHLFGSSIDCDLEIAFR